MSRPIYERYALMVLASRVARPDEWLDPELAPPAAALVFSTVGTDDDIAAAVRGIPSSCFPAEAASAWLAAGRTSAATHELLQVLGGRGRAAATLHLAADLEVDAPELNPWDLDPELQAWMGWMAVMEAFGGTDAYSLFSTGGLRELLDEWEPFDGWTTPVGEVLHYADLILLDLPDDPAAKSWVAGCCAAWIGVEATAIVQAASTKGAGEAREKLVRQIAADASLVAPLMAAHLAG